MTIHVNIFVLRALSIEEIFISAWTLYSCCNGISGGTPPEPESLDLKYVSIYKIFLAKDVLPAQQEIFKTGTCRWSVWSINYRQVVPGWLGAELVQDVGAGAEQVGVSHSSWNNNAT